MNQAAETTRGYLAWGTCECHTNGTETGACIDGCRVAEECPNCGGLMTGGHLLLAVALPLVAIATLTSVPLIWRLCTLVDRLTRNVHTGKASPQGNKVSPKGIEM